MPKHAQRMQTMLVTSRLCRCRCIASWIESGSNAMLDRRAKTSSRQFVSTR